MLGAAIPRRTNTPPNTSARANIPSCSRSRRNQGLVTGVIFPHPRQTNKLQMVTDLMQRLQASTLSLLLWALVFVPGSAPASFAQQVNPENRKIVNRVTPQYPEIARGMNLSGSVKAD